MNINDFLKMSNHEILAKLETLAEIINGFLQKEFYVDPNIQSKTRKNDIVTQSDKNAEKLIISNLEVLFGRNIGIFSEECGGQVIDDKPSFIIDPIDGSSRFADRKHSFGAFVALQYQGQIHASLICMPMSDTYWIGVANKLVKHNFLGSHRVPPGGL